MASCCICYTTDTTYFLPSFVSAIQARRHSSRSLADIAIICIGPDSETSRMFAKACDAESIRYIPVDENTIDGAGPMLARLFLDRLIPEQYDQLLYIDSDTQVAGSLDPLIRSNIPSGHFMAASDPMTFSMCGNGAHDRDLVAHFAGLGITAEQYHHYFNSGVLRINRDGWDEIGMAAWQYFKAMQGPSRFPDQDALNIVAMDRRIPMSLAWNFPIFLRNARVEQEIIPCIYHYMGSPKPWHGNFLPWGLAEFRPYVQAVRAHPDLAPYLTRLPLLKKVKYVLQQHYKRGLESVTWGTGRRHLEILNYEKDLSMPCGMPLSVG